MHSTHRAWKLLIDPKSLALATVEKDRLEQDMIFARLTSGQLKAIRDCILQKMPSFQMLVEVLCKHLQTPSKARKKR